MDPDAKESPSLKRHACWLIFTLALLLRLIFLFQWRATPYYSNLVVDAMAHQRWAMDILGGKLLREQAFYQSPFYPYLLAGIYKIAGAHLLVPLFLQSIVSAFTCVLVGKIAEISFDRKTGIIAACLCAVYAPLIFYSALLLKETFAIFALALFALLALRSFEKGGGKTALLCGLAGGWTVLSRGNIVLLLPLLPVFWLFLRSRVYQPGRMTALFLLGIILPILPATLHNYAASRDFVPVNYTDGFIFYAGNNAGAVGAMDYPPGISSSPAEEEKETSEIASSALGHTAKPSEVSSFWRRRAFAEITAHPRDWCILTLRKFYFFINRFEPPDQYHLPFITDNFGTILKFPLPGFGIICTLGIFGLIFLRTGARANLIASFATVYMLSVVAVTVSDRYRLPVVVFLLPFAAFAIRSMFTGVLWYALRKKAAWTPVALGLLAVCWLPTPLNRPAIEAQCWGKLMFMYSLRGDDKTAIECLKRAFAASPEVPRESIEMGALIYEKHGDSASAQSLRSRLHPSPAPDK
jgi:4-amino-4-deoxy-L-arabinose transferase-like glycosyltransferase